jgi:glutaredoxin 3
LKTFSTTLDSTRLLAELTARHPVFLLTKSHCRFCKKAKKLLQDIRASFHEVELDGLPKQATQKLQDDMRASTGAGSVPRVYVSGVCIGGFDETQRRHWSGGLVPLLIRARAVDAKDVPAEMNNDPNPFL